MTARTRMLIAVACAAVAAAAAVGGDEGAATRSAARTRVSESIRRLRQSGMEAPPPTEEQTDLQRMIERVRRLHVTKPVARPGALPPEVAPQTQPIAIDTQPARPPAVLTPEVLAQIEKTPVAEMVDPVGLADAVQRAGFEDSAYRLYENVLKAGARDKQTDWILLQMASCIRRREPATAGRLYGRLLAECPDSPWRQVAKTQNDLIEWFATSKLRAEVAPRTQPAPAAAPAAKGGSANG